MIVTYAVTPREKKGRTILMNRPAPPVAYLAMAMEMAKQMAKP
jgi:hypothetical protein